MRVRSNPSPVSKSFILRNMQGNDLRMQIFAWKLREQSPLPHPAQAIYTYALRLLWITRLYSFFTYDLLISSLSRSFFFYYFLLFISDHYTHVIFLPIAYTYTFNKNCFCFFSYRMSQVKEQQYRFHYSTRRCIISAAHCNPPRNVSQETELL